MEALGINAAGLLTQIVSFLILFVGLRILLYKPILRALDGRSQRIKESLESADKAKQEADSSREDIQKKLDEARAEGQEMIAQAREMADRFKEEELVKVRAAIGAERDKAEAELKHERDAAIEELREHFAGLAMSAAERMMSRTLDQEAHRDIIDDVLKESSKINGSTR
jgi:F-type H+-transporting ATPase subunit b